VPAYARHMTPTELTRAYIDAYNRRDEQGMREFLPDHLVYVRPGPTVLHTADEVMDLYRSEWHAYDSRCEIRTEYEDGDVFAGEVTLVSGRNEVEVECGVFHRWVDGKLVHYRAYVDPRPTA
jgi:ketosteroid isomerase-like protein